MDLTARKPKTFPRVLGTRQTRICLTLCSMGPFPAYGSAFAGKRAPGCTESFFRVWESAAADSVAVPVALATLSLPDAASERAAKGEGVETDGLMVRFGNSEMPIRQFPERGDFRQSENRR